MEQVEFEVEQLKVVVYTNITNSKDEMVEFNRSMLHIPKTDDDENNTEMTLVNLPFFTAEIEYPITRLNRMNYHDRVNFFFNQKYFIDILRPYYDPNMLLNQHIATLNNRISKLKLKIGEIDNLLKPIYPDSPGKYESAITYLNKSISEVDTDGINTDATFKNAEKMVKNIHVKYKILSSATRLHVKVQETINKSQGVDDDIQNTATESSKNALDKAINIYQTPDNGSIITTATDAYTAAKRAHTKLIEAINDENDDDWEYDDDDSYWDEDSTTSSNASSSLNSGIYTQDDDDDDGTHYYAERNYSVRERITRKNIKTMLEILFPTKFPVINDVQTSYEYIQNQKSTRPFWFNPFQTHYFSYLTISGKIHTVKKTVWLNDILNHPVYQKIFIEYRKLKKWADEKGYNMDDTDENHPKNIFTTTLDAVHTDYSAEIPVRKFKTTMLGFVQPLRNSSNTYLQKLIDGLTSKTKNETENTKHSIEFYELLDNIYDKYINSDSDSDSKQNISAYINTGISYINMGESNKPTREVYFMIDLIDGEINDKNKSSIYCPYMGDSLGNKLEYLINNPQTDNNKWAVDKNRQIFSLSKMKETISGNDYKQKMEEGPSNPSKNVGYKQLNPSKNVGYKQSNPSNRPTNEISINTEVSNNFMTYILKVEKDKPDEVENIIKKLKFKYMDSNITSIDKSRLLDSMQNLSTLSNKLVGAIIKWSKDIQVQTPGVTELLITIKNAINTQNELNSAKKKRYSVDVYDTSGQEKLKIDRDTDINNLLLLIVGKVQKHEASKNRRISGGTKKKKTRSKKNTRRRRE
tara:strand:+ start:5627 stop:8053 length:2427 start_codon:yes stop_codon:yes gene_type:complete